MRKIRELREGKASRREVGLEEGKEGLRREEGFRDGQQALRLRWDRSGTYVICATQRILTKCPSEAVSTFQQTPGRKLTNLQAFKCVLFLEGLTP